MSNKNVKLVMDLGGTNIRIACLDSSNGLSKIETWSCLEFNGPDAALSSYQDKHQCEIESLCIAIASPLDDDQVNMTNLDWSFSKQALKKQLSINQLIVINDYHAMGMAIPLLGSSDKIQIGGGTIKPEKPALICGPGTGLGVAIAVRTNNFWQVLPGEGGHMDFAPATPYEQQIWSIFHRKYGHVSAERILSGPGLEELHSAICEIDGLEPESLSADQISAMALDGSSATCEKTLHQFCAILGSFCGSLALATASFGGVYITGGIVPRFIDFLKDSEFRMRFEDKGRYRSYIEKIPSFVVTAEYPGLLGAAAFLQQSN
jgi:glucokinase